MCIITFFFSFFFFFFFFYEERERVPFLRQERGTGTSSFLIGTFPTLILVEKLEILNKLENCDKLEKIANKFEVGRATMYNI